MKVASVGFAANASLDYVERHGRPERPVCSLAGHRMIRTAWLIEEIHAARAALAGDSCE